MDDTLKQVNPRFVDAASSFLPVNAPPPISLGTVAVCRTHLS